MKFMSGSTLNKGIQFTGELKMYQGGEIRVYE